MPVPNPIPRLRGERVPRLALGGGEARPHYRRVEEAHTLALLSEQLLEVLTKILSNTVINCLFYCLGCGWGVTIFEVNRNIITNTVIIGGSLYLLMLA